MVFTYLCSLVSQFGSYKTRLTLEDKGKLSQAQPRSSPCYSCCARRAIFARTD